ncbi:MAG TPA: tRNA lysidine(34) synthetase TilS [Pseudolabrys sp.]|uniref:tRNA lysidine(34) synthetase TilS n=1 Tax=Pseudolabrys sp. TaxID=1960880 RepID=UPI002DDCB8A2|nr:tRNA lysidine(34) synthetase TilS [Pseudolabrys sp.]HEV2628371.1 tRNA lysidine(34) synthetase TilS [Pseudolabrys sp.]
MSTAETIVSAAEAASLFEDLASFPALLLAVSGGPDSTALMVLAARWRKARKNGPALIAVTVDHGLRKESAAEARAVAKLARQLGIQHRTLRWTGAKPKTGLPRAARVARYRLLAAAARKAGAPAILTAHTLDDQAETVLIRMSRGSGLTGLAGMQRVSALPGDAGGRGEPPRLVRPFLDIPKARLIATLKAAKVPFAEDPSNHDPRFTRARLRGLMPILAAEGLDAARLALLARRLARAEAALAAAAAAALCQLAAKPGERGILAFDRSGFLALPGEIAQRVLGRAIDAAGDEGPVELGKLEVLCTALNAAAADPKARFRRSLAGALVSLTPRTVTVERAPARRRRTLTTRRAAASGGGQKPLD